MRQPWTSVLSGAVAGAVSVVTFALVHDLLISDIWFSLAWMMAPGVLCGMSLGWTYALLFERASLGSWLRFNLLFVGMFVLLAIVSIAAFEPVTTAAEVISGGRPPDDLFASALPLSGGFTLVVSVLVGYRYGRSWRDYAAVIVTCSLLVLFLGLNVAIIGLVDVPGSALYLIWEMFALIVVLDVVYLAAFAGLQYRNFAPQAVRATAGR